MREFIFCKNPRENFFPWGSPLSLFEVKEEFTRGDAYRTESLTFLAVGTEFKEFFRKVG